MSNLKQAQEIYIEDHDFVVVKRDLRNTPVGELRDMLRLINDSIADQKVFYQEVKESGYEHHSLAKKIGHYAVAAHWINKELIAAAQEGSCEATEQEITIANLKLEISRLMNHVNQKDREINSLKKFIAGGNNGS